MLSLGMLLALALAMQSRRRALNSGLAEPPSLIAIAISRPILVKILAFFASFAPLRLAILCHLECPDMLECPSFYHNNFNITSQGAIRRRKILSDFGPFFKPPAYIFRRICADYTRKLQKGR